MDAGKRSSRFRLFQSQHSYQQRRRLQYLPWPSGPDAADVQLCIAADGMVSRLPSRAAEVFASARPGVQHALRAAVPGETFAAGWKDLFRPVGPGNGPGEEV